MPDNASGLTTGARPFERFNRGLWLLHPRRTGKHANQYCWSHRRCQECAEGFPHVVGKRYRDKRYFSQRVQRYQSAIAATKVRLNLAVAQGVWLLPARMVINTESVVGSKNNLRTAEPAQGVKLGVNNGINQGTKKAALKHMAGEPSKVNPPNSHPANPIHKQAVQAQGLAPAKAPPRAPKPPQAPTDTPAVAPPQAPTDTPAVAPSVEPHHVNKALVAVGAFALAGFVAWMS